MSTKHMCWFVDLENVGVSRFRACFLHFGENDVVYIVYSEACLNGAEECKKDLTALSVDAKLVFSPLSGNNALDFVLVAELSRVSMLEPDNEYFIVSVDLGFDSAVLYLRHLGISVKRVSPSKLGLQSGVEITPLNEAQRRVLYDFIVTNGLKLKGGERYQRLNEICQRYGPSCRKANLVYRSLKPILDNKVELQLRKEELGFFY